jgi:hypothetical protein
MTERHTNNGGEQSTKRDDGAPRADKGCVQMQERGGVDTNSKLTTGHSMLLQEQ